MANKLFQSIKSGISNSWLLKMLRNKYVVVTIFFVVWVLFIDSNNLISWYGDLREVSSQERQKLYYKDAIQKTDEKLKELSSNKDSLEKFAREQYLFHNPDEEVFIVKDAK